MPCLLRDVDRLAETTERLGKPPERAERHRQCVPHERSLDGGLPESLRRQILREQCECGLAVSDGLAALIS